MCVYVRVCVCDAYANLFINLVHQVTSCGQKADWKSDLTARPKRLTLTE